MEDKYRNFLKNNRILILFSLLYYYTVYCKATVFYWYDLNFIMYALKRIVLLKIRFYFQIEQFYQCELFKAKYRKLLALNLFEKADKEEKYTQIRKRGKLFNWEVSFFCKPKK